MSLITKYEVKSLPIIPNIANQNVNYHIINGNHVIHDKDINSTTYGIYKIESTSNVNDLINIFDYNSGTYWKTFSEYGNKSDDPLTSTTIRDANSGVCAGDNYNNGSCIHNYSGQRTTDTITSYRTKKGKTNLTSTYPGETIDIVFPRPFYIYESYLEFKHNQHKPKAYFLLGYSQKDKVWKMIGRNLNVSYNTDHDKIKINTVDRYTSVKLVITAGREQDHVKINKFYLNGNSGLIGNPIKNYNGLKEYNKHDNFENMNEKTVSFSDNVEVYHYDENNNYNLINFIPTLFILSILGLAIIKKK